MPDHGKPLRRTDMTDDPLEVFAAWFAEANGTGMRTPEAAALATASADGAPSVRMVLVKELDERGFAFFTNYDSRKGHELRDNPRAALLFHWDELGRQVRVEGPVQRVDREESAVYAHSRPRGSQLSALASPQSQPIESRSVLEQRVAELERLHDGEQVPLPDGWGGFRMTVESFEFWQQRHDRLHDRFRYRREEDGGWLIERLAP